VSPRAPVKKAKTRGRPKLSKAEREQRRLQRRQKSEIRAVFDAAGFTRVGHAADVEFRFDSHVSDFDDVFVLENVVVLVEYTTTQSNGISEHIKKKDILYKTITESPERFMAFARGKPLKIDDPVLAKYADHQIQLVVLYCAREQVPPSVKQQISFVKYFDYEIVQYFKSLTGAIRKSARYEFLDFLGVGFEEFDSQSIHPGSGQSRTFSGSVLPETHSNFPPGYKVASLYMDPQSLLSRAYVLRRDGWRDGGATYQRLIIKSKIEALRKYLLDQQRVFVNNVIVTLPQGTKILDGKGNTIDTSAITSTRAASIQITEAFNSVGIVDGQHRLYSYHEGGSNDDKVGRLRAQQNLLVTGIVYPEDVPDRERERFEAKLFLEINANQANARSDLKQAILQILDPFSDDSVARAVLVSLNQAGPLAGMFQRFSWETRLLKTTTVVSYGLRPLVRVTTSKLFADWTDPSKPSVLRGKDEQALERYIKYASDNINIFLAAAKKNLASQRWRVRDKGDDGLVTTTLVNGLLGAMRQGLDSGVAIEFEGLDQRFRSLARFNFAEYKSSQYTRMSSALAQKFLT